MVKTDEERTRNDDDGGNTICAPSRAFLPPPSLSPLSLLFLLKVHLFFLFLRAWKVLFYYEQKWCDGIVLRHFCACEMVTCVVVMCSRIIIICYLINTFSAYFSFNRTTGVVFIFFRVCTCSQYVYFFRVPYSRQSREFNCLLTRSLACFAFILFSNYGSIRWLFRNGGFQ